MQFSSPAFLLFLGVVLALHRLPLSWSARKRNLLFLSCVFYAAWNPPFVLLLAVSTVADWVLARRIHRARGATARRGLLGLSLLVNLGMLSYFKYGAFLAESTSALLHSVGVDWRPVAPGIVLPIGISFYTFQTLSYTLDVYHRRFEPWHSFLDYALFVTFFPQLVAGPIVRAREFLPQCGRPAVVTGAHYGWAMALFVLGLFMKIVLADAYLAPEVERVFDAARAPTAGDAWLASFAFGAQIYCDFAGYSLCAIGVAHALGFRLPVNFRFPLAAIGFRDAWSRWHITLTNWLRDYVFKTVRDAGGARSPWVWLFAVLVTWGLIGLWHGAAWRFVFWGLLAGCYLVLERVVCSLAPRSQVWNAVPVLFLFACLQFTLSVTLAPLFRSGTSARAGVMLRSMLGGAPAEARAVLVGPGAVLAIATVGLLFLSNWLMRGSSLEKLAARTPWAVQALALGAMLAVLVLDYGSDRAFLYFQF